jgi:exodeoxyribonuclease VII small subunit
MSKSTPQNEDLPFEDAMQRLDEIVNAMETDRMPLEEMIRSYEEGIRLLKSCRQRIDNARHRVETITADLESGKASTTTFEAAPIDTDDDSDDEKPARTTPPRRRKSAADEEIRLF